MLAYRQFNSVSIEISSALAVSTKLITLILRSARSTIPI